MKFFIALLVVCFTFEGFTQNVNDSYGVDRLVLSIPAREANTTADIAAYIKKNFDTDGKKVRAAYTWVAANIRYSSDSMRPVIFEEDREHQIAVALRRREGVCENYAAIFNDICLKSGLRSLLVEGYTRQSGSMDRSPHAWCVVYVDKDWYLYDPTWDEDRAHRAFSAGSLNYDYFQATPEIFIQSHMPFDPMFQLLNYPITYKEFYTGNTQVNHNKAYFNYADSIAAYQKLNPLEKYVSAASRIEKNGPPNTMITNKLNKLKMYIEIIYQDRDTTLYNSAVAEYNDALTLFNSFLTYRNNRFTPAKTDSEIQTIFEGIEKQVASANAKVDEVNRSKAGLTLNTFALQKVLNELSIHAREQQDFLKSYLSSVKVK